MKPSAEQLLKMHHYTTFTITDTHNTSEEQINQMAQYAAENMGFPEDDIVKVLANVSGMTHKEEELVYMVDVYVEFGEEKGHA